MHYYVCVFRSKNVKVVVDHIKVVIKSGKKHSAAEKLRCLELLDKCVMGAKRNPEFVAYV